MYSFLPSACFVASICFPHLAGRVFKEERIWGFCTAHEKLVGRGEPGMMMMPLRTPKPHPPPEEIDSQYTCIAFSRNVCQLSGFCLCPF